MDGLKGWLDQQIDNHLVEPNSALGKAIGYMQKHWDTLTRFYPCPVRLSTIIWPSGL
jgi:hypothetical protein